MKIYEKYLNESKSNFEKEAKQMMKTIDNFIGKMEEFRMDTTGSKNFNKVSKEFNKMESSYEKFIDQLLNTAQDIDKDY